LILIPQYILFSKLYFNKYLNTSLDTTADYTILSMFFQKKFLFSQQVFLVKQFTVTMLQYGRQPINKFLLLLEAVIFYIIKF